MSGPGVGYQYPSTEVSWLKRDVLLFAVSIGCTVDELHFIYVHLYLYLSLYLYLYPYSVTLEDSPFIGPELT
jgi:hypothetical protein